MFVESDSEVSERCHGFSSSLPRDATPVFIIADVASVVDAVLDRPPMTSNQG